MESGLSTSLRRQAVSHGAAHTEPQIEALGLGSTASPHAYTNSPAAARLRYPRQLVFTGQASWQGMLSWYQDGPTSTTWYSTLTRGSCYRRHMARQTSRAIIERKTRLDGSLSEYQCETLSLEVDRRAVLRYVTDREWIIGDTGVVVRPGQITIAHYWIDRPYNVYHWLDGGPAIADSCHLASD